jgi:hypothetical protein
MFACQTPRREDLPENVYDAVNGFQYEVCHNRNYEHRDLEHVPLLVKAFTDRLFLLTPRNTRRK